MILNKDSLILNIKADVVLADPPYYYNGDKRKMFVGKKDAEKIAKLIVNSAKKYIAVYTGYHPFMRSCLYFEAEKNNFKWWDTIIVIRQKNRLLMKVKRKLVPTYIMLDIYYKEKEPSIEPFRKLENPFKILNRHRIPTNLLIVPNYNLGGLKRRNLVNKPWFFHALILKSFMLSDNIETVFDPFSGGGSTAIACEVLGLKYICSEKDKEAIEVMKENLLLTDKLIEKWNEYYGIGA